MKLIIEIDLGEDTKSTPWWIPLVVNNTIWPEHFEAGQSGVVHDGFDESLGMWKVIEGE